jgi:hypothetical protein
MSDIPQISGAKILEIIGAETSSQDVYIKTDKGTLYLFHSQSCCERSDIDEIEGNPEDLKGAIVSGLKVKTKESGEQEWTFYDLQTTKGDLFIKWLGDRSIGTGYYSIECDCLWFPYSEPLQKGMQLANEDFSSFIWIHRNIDYSSSELASFPTHEYEEYGSGNNKVVTIYVMPDENGYFHSSNGLYKIYK